MLKLNLGSGMRKFEGHVNIDINPDYEPDLVLDFETQKLPYKNDSVDVIKCYHLLEHLNPRAFNTLLKEMYRVSKNGTIIRFVTPHENSSLFHDDPTHVRPVTPGMMALHSQNAFRMAWEKYGHILTPFWRNLKVDFDMGPVGYALDEHLPEEVKADHKKWRVAARYQTNVVMEYQWTMTAVKPYEDKGNPEGMDEFVKSNTKDPADD